MNTKLSKFITKTKKSDIPLYLWNPTIRNGLRLAHMLYLILNKANIKNDNRSFVFEFDKRFLNTFISKTLTKDGGATVDCKESQLKNLTRKLSELKKTGLIESIPNCPLTSKIRLKKELLTFFMDKSNKAENLLYYILNDKKNYYHFFKELITYINFQWSGERRGVSELELILAFHYIKNNPSKTIKHLADFILLNRNQYRNKTIAFQSYLKSLDYGLKYDTVKDYMNVIVSTFQHLPEFDTIAFQKYRNHLEFTDRKDKEAEEKTKDWMIKFPESRYDKNYVKADYFNTSTGEFEKNTGLHFLVNCNSEKIIYDKKNTDFSGIRVGTNGLVTSHVAGKADFSTIVEIEGNKYNIILESSLERSRMGQAKMETIPCFTHAEGINLDNDYPTLLFFISPNISELTEKAYENYNITNLSNDISACTLSHKDYCEKTSIELIEYCLNKKKDSLNNFVSLNKDLISKLMVA